MQLNVMNWVKSGKMSIDEVLIRANNGTLKAEELWAGGAVWAMFKTPDLHVNEDLKILSAF